jgi:deoxyribose-phosphate aldolase
MQLNHYFDHTLLRPDALDSDIRTLCEQAVQYQFAAVCVLPVWVPLARSVITASPCKLCSVVGFPLGANQTIIKAMETSLLVQEGVQEIDMVINIGALKSGYHAEVAKDIQAVVKSADTAIVKVIIETCLLTDDEKRLASRMAVEAGAHFVKTSTGFSKSGATVHDVALIRQVVGPDIGVKASGGIRDLATARAMIEAGANRLGTSSSVAIINEFRRP